VDAAEFIAARERLNLTSPTLAVELGLTPHVVAAFEDGSLAVPKDIAKEIRWRVAILERQEALETSGLADCAWVLTWEDAPMPWRSSEMVKHLEAFTDHTSTCPTCLARERFIDERFGPMPERPMSGWQGILLAITSRVERLPQLLQPAANGALLFLAMSAVRVVFMLPRLTQTPHGWLLSLGALAASAAIGAVVGSAFAAARWGWRRMRAGNMGTVPKRRV
jgi:hypothetical protein